MPTKSLRIFSGIQPTGGLHLGNYFGAVRQWIRCQNGSDVDACLFSIVDLHSLTVPQSRHSLRSQSRLMCASLLGAGLDPRKCVLFQQSCIPFHGQLCWLLGTLSTMAQLNRFPQFKEKTEGMEEVPLGLFIYPVLQAADILLYKANCVPVGEDQMAHLYFARHLADKFNNAYENIFPVPEAIIGDTGFEGFSGRIKSLRYPEKKMSKSDPDSMGRIDITDTDDVILRRIKRAVTDFKSEVTFEPTARLGVSNLVAIYSLVTGLTPQQVCEQSRGLSTGQFKLALADLLIEHLRPIRQEVLRLMSEEQYLNDILSDGASKAHEIAASTMKQVYESVGLKFILK